MANVRVFYAEMDGSEEAVQAVIAAFADRVAGAPLPGHPIAIAPAPERPRALPAATAPKPTKVAAPRERVSTPEKPTTMADTVRGALKIQPLTNGAIERLLKDKGFDTDSRRVTVMLCGMRTNGEIYKRDEDYAWCLAERS